MNETEAKTLIAGLLEGVEEDGALFLSYDLEGANLKVFRGGTICIWPEKHLYQRDVMTYDLSVAAYFLSKAIHLQIARVSGKKAYEANRQARRGMRAPGYELTKYRDEHRRKVAAAKRREDEERWAAR